MLCIVGPEGVDGYQSGVLRDVRQMIVVVLSPLFGGFELLVVAAADNGSASHCCQAVVEEDIFPFSVAISEQFVKIIAEFTAVSVTASIDTTSEGCATAEASASAVAIAFIS